MHYWLIANVHVLIDGCRTEDPSKRTHRMSLLYPYNDEVDTAAPGTLTAENCQCRPSKC